MADRIIPNKQRRTAKARELTTEERQQLAAAADGLTPLQFAASILRDEAAPFEKRQWAAELLMPYMHRRLPTAVDVTTRSLSASVDLNALGTMDERQLEQFLDALNQITAPTGNAPSGRLIDGRTAH